MEHEIKQTGWTVMADQAAENTGVVAALFDHETQAADAISALRDAGFSEAGIGVVYHVDDREYGGDTVTQDVGGSSRVGDGAIAGGVIGLLLGVTVVLLPGVGPLIAGGLAVQALGAGVAGAGIGAIGGGLIAGLVGMGIPEDQANHVDTAVRSGRVLVTVRTDARIESAVQTLRDHAGVVVPAPSERPEGDGMPRGLIPALGVGGSSNTSIAPSIPIRASDPRDDWEHGRPVDSGAIETSGETPEDFERDQETVADEIATGGRA